MDFNEEINKEMREAFAHPDAYKVGVKDGYDDAIEKACEWLRNNLGYYDRHEVHIGKSYEEVVIDDFRKEMEE